MNEVPSLNLVKILRGGGDVSDQGKTNLLEYSVETTHGLEVVTLPLHGTAEWRAIASHIGEQEFWLAGTIEATLNLECGRCLDPVTHSMEARLESLLRFDPNTKTPKRTLTDDDEEVILFGDPNLNLTALFAEAISLEIPAMVKCRANCKGLCASCGMNLNNTSACKEARADCPSFGVQETKKENPFAVLKDLFKD